jgi:hypothetical protein
MPLTIKTFTDAYNKIKTDIFTFSNGKLQAEKDPTVTAFASSSAVQEIDLRKTIDYSIMQALFSTISTDEPSILNMGIRDTKNEIRRKQAEFANGKVIITAIPQTTTVIIPANTEFSGNNNLNYKTIIQRDCVEQKFFITSLIRTDNYVYATIANHELSNGLTVNITSTVLNSFTGSYSIELVNANVIRYLNAGINETAIGNYSLSFFGAIVDVESIEPALLANLTNTDTLTISSNIEGIDKAYITYSGFLNGTDIEDIIDFRDRITDYLSKPRNKGNIFQYESYLKQNTTANYINAFAFEDLTDIYLTFVLSIYDSNIDFGNYSENALNEIKSKFIAENQVPLEFDFVNILFTNPSFQGINIAISNLSPNTNDMQTQIQKELKRYINLLPIKKKLSNNFNELSTDKIKEIIFGTRDSFGKNPTFSNVTVNGTGSLVNNIDKPILGTLTF